MKKFLLLTLSLLLMLNVCIAETAPLQANVYVSITDESGNLVLAYDSVCVTDQNDDGALTLHDALACAHILYNENGADAYNAVATEYGLSLTKLWGVENGGAYGYYLNDASAWSLLDPVAEGDHVKAYVYTDLVTWSDTYTFFNTPALQANANEAITLTLYAAGYDANFMPVTLLVEGAVLTVNGEATDVVTDSEGNAAFMLTEDGLYVVSACAEGVALVAPVCIITVGTAQ